MTLIDTDLTAVLDFIKVPHEVVTAASRAAVVLDDLVAGVAEIVRDFVEQAVGRQVRNVGHEVCSPEGAEKSSEFRIERRLVDKGQHRIDMCFLNGLSLFRFTGRSSSPPEPFYSGKALIDDRRDDLP